MVKSLSTQTPESKPYKPLKSQFSFPDDIMGKNICGDAVEIMSCIPDGAVELVVTSPPYNLKNSTGNGMKDGRGGKWANAALQKGYSHHHDCMPHDEYVRWQRRCLTEMMRVIPDHGAIFYNHKWRVQGGLLQDRQDIVTGFPVRQIIIWKRKGGRHGAAKPGEAGKRTSRTRRYDATIEDAVRALWEASDRVCSNGSW